MQPSKQQQLWQSVSTCWQSVSAQVSPHLERLGGSLGQLAAPWLPGGASAAAAAGGTVTVCGRQYAVLRKIGEGGYSFVYLVREAEGSAPPGAEPRTFALKKMLAGTREQLESAEAEVALMRRLPQHPSLLRLLAADAAPVDTPAGAARAVYMLFPYYEGGNLFDHVRALAEQGQGPPLAVLASVFEQVCSAVEVLHSQTPALAHRDIKPHNVLLRWAAGGAPPAAVLMDFGSARPAHVEVRSRQQAVELQEEAERHCSAPYRAPELWDPPSQCDVGPATDVWALGCLLYFLLARGESPFERTANEAGGSLALAVMNGRVTWPKEAEEYPAALRQLAEACLSTDPAARPSAEQARRRAGEAVGRPA